MRIHIQHCQTRKYLNSANQWVPEAQAANNFSNSMDALRHCIQQGLAGVNIVVDLGGHRTPMCIPFDLGSPEPAQLMRA